VLLEQAIDEVVRRHEILRTRFVSMDGQPMQIVDAAMPARLPLIDLAGLDEAAQQAELRRLVDGEVRRPFDLARGPLVRTKLLRLAPMEHVLVCAMHHIVTDAWSFRVLGDELSTLCAAFRAGEPSQLLEQPISTPTTRHGSGRGLAATSSPIAWRTGATSSRMRKCSCSCRSASDVRLCNRIAVVAKSSTSMASSSTACARSVVMRAPRST
jgi:hypothetical protein